MNKKTQVTRGSGVLEAFLAKKRADKVNSLIKEESLGGKLLDIGCGSYPWFLKAVSVKERYGLDKSLTSEVINQLKQPDLKLSSWDYIEEKSLPFTDNTFDTVTMLAVFEHIELTHLDNLLSDIFRILKPGGRFIMTTPAAWTDPLLRFFAFINIVSKEEIEDHKDTYTRNKVAKILAGNGFSEQNIETGTFEMFMNLWATADKPVVQLKH